MTPREQMNKIRVRKDVNMSEEKQEEKAKEVSGISEWSPLENAGCCGILYCVTIIIPTNDRMRMCSFKKGSRSRKKEKNALCTTRPIRFVVSILAANVYNNAMEIASILVNIVNSLT